MAKANLSVLAFWLWVLSTSCFKGKWREHRNG